MHRRHGVVPGTTQGPMTAEPSTKRRKRVRGRGADPRVDQLAVRLAHADQEHDVGVVGPGGSGLGKPRVGHPVADRWPSPALLA